MSMFKATSIEFRLRYVIHLAIFLLGFAVPWNSLLHLDIIRAWQYVASWPTRNGWMSFSNATIAVLVAGIVLAFAAAFLRTWASAYLGPGVVRDAAMRGERMVAAGPYRRMRNPLYVGIFLHTLALALLMPTSGAVFAIVAIAIVETRLILAEEPFLEARLGEPYRAYCAKVPRLFPALTPRVPDPGVKPAWGTSFLAEIYFWGAFVSFATLGWRYNSLLIGQGLLVSMGVSFIVRALLPKQAEPVETMP